MTVGQQKPSAPAPYLFPRPQAERHPARQVGDQGGGCIVDARGRDRTEFAVLMTAQVDHPVEHAVHTRLELSGRQLLKQFGIAGQRTQRRGHRNQAPAATRSSAISENPRFLASSSGVLPYLSVMCGLAPLSSSSLTISCWSGPPSRSTIAS